MKICTKCKTEKDEKEFYLNSHKSEARCLYRSACKACDRKAYKAHYDKTPDYQKFKGKRYSKSKRGKENHKIVKKRYQQTYKGVYWNYKGNAKHSGFEFNLTMQDFKNFESKNCFYCGEKLTRVGLDRKDNSKGYTLDNVNPCCSTCNYMRRIQTQEEFIAKCHQISERFGVKNAV